MLVPHITVNLSFAALEKGLGAVLHEVIRNAESLTSVCPCVAVFKYSQYLTVGGENSFDWCLPSKAIWDVKLQKVERYFFPYEKSFRLFSVLPLCRLCRRRLVSRESRGCCGFVTGSGSPDASDTVVHAMVSLLYWKKCSRIFYSKGVVSLALPHGIKHPLRGITCWRGNVLCVYLATRGFVSCKGCMAVPFSLASKKCT